ncbi:MAG: hypothetical protein A2075_16620 [Geobacteraceae bacterium GWC2_58_44]|nr:MAG: hypothetical protein A2075_16620 [Geobacteraceae bacterium GWC2_58_44]
MRLIFLKPKRGPVLTGFARAVDQWLCKHEKEYDLIHSNGYYTIPHSFRAKGDRPPIIRHMRGSNWTILRAACRDDLFQWSTAHLRTAFSCLIGQFFDRLSVKTSDHIVANCQETLEDTVIKIPMPPDKISVLYNGIEFPSVRPEKNALSDFRRRTGLGNRFLISCLASISSGKGWGYLCDIAGALRKRGSVFTLLVMGDGPLRGALESAVERNGLKDCTVFAGAIRGDEEKLLFLSASDLFLYPSSPGTTVLEALLAGVPIAIARRTQDCSAGMDWEPLDKIGVGRIFHDCMPEEIAAALEPIIATRDRLGCEKGLEYCRDELSWERTGAQAESIYSRVIHGTRGKT